MLKILFIPISAVGHVNSAIGMAQVLLERGHKIVFAISDQWRGKLAKYGFEEVLFKREGAEEDEDPVKGWALHILKLGLFNKESALKSALNKVKAKTDLFEAQMKLDKEIEDLLPQIKPDVIICDQIVGLPSVETSGIPWVLVCSCNPLFIIEDERTPPGNSGKANFILNKSMIYLYLNSLRSRNRFTRFGSRK